MKTQSRESRFAVAFLLLVVVASFTLAAAAFGDGKVTQPQVSDPVATWKIIDLRFPLESAQHSAIIQVGYFRQSGARDHVVEIDASDADYDSLLYAINTASGADESTLTKPDGSIDLGAIFRLRISRWMINHAKIDGVTAEPLTDQTPANTVPQPTPPSTQAQTIFVNN